MRRPWHFALRELTLDLGPRLGSWRLSIVLMIVAALYYAFLAIWAGSSPPHVVQNIAGLLPFWLVYGMLLLNTGVCLWRRIPTLRRECRADPTLTQRQSDWEIRTADTVEPRRVRAALRRTGYRKGWENDGTLGGIRYRWAGLGTFLFHGSFFLVALGFLMTLAMRQEASIWVAVGEKFEARSDQYLSQSSPRLLGSSLNAPAFSVESIRPVFWRKELLFTHLEANLILADGTAAQTRINRPLWMGWGMFLRLSGFGYTPRYQLQDEFGHVLDSAFVKLNVFPPGIEDYFSLPDLPHRVYVQIFPDFAVEDGEPITRSLNLTEPAVATHVHRGHIDLGNAVLGPNDGYRFEGLRLSFPEIRYWGEFSIVRDPGVPFLFLGYLLGLVGLLFKVRGGRQEAEWQREPDGSGVLRGWGGPQPRRLAALGDQGGSD